MSEQNYHTTKLFVEYLLPIEMKNSQITVNKPVYLGLSILYLGKTVMYEFWYDSIKPSYTENSKRCFMDADSFIVHAKTDDTYQDIAEDIEKRFYNSKYEIGKPLPKGRNKKVIELMKDELVTNHERIC